MKYEQYDITIIGSGLVGASLACALSHEDFKLNFKIALIDKQAVNSTNNEINDNDARALALSSPSISCLTSIGIWPLKTAVGSLKIEPIKSVHVSSKGHFGVSHLQAKSKGLSELGFVVNADVLTRALAEKAAKLPNVTLYRPREIVELNKSTPSEGEHWTVTLNNNEKINTNLIVAADGAFSFLRSHQGIPAVIHDHNHDAIISNVSSSKSHEGVAYERFLEQGSIAMLPCGDHRAKCVWVVPNSESEKILNLSELEYLSRLKSNFGSRLGSLLSSSTRIKFPLKSIVAENLYGRGFVLIGNAANTLHPIAAQGFNLGLRDAATLAEVLAYHKNLNASRLFDLGAIAALQDYAERRRTDHSITRQFTRSLADATLPLSSGILASEFIPGLKNKLFDLGLGKQNNLPKLCRNREKYEVNK